MQMPSRSIKLPSWSCLTATPSRSLTKNGEIDIALNVPVDVGVNYPNQNEV